MRVALVSLEFQEDLMTLSRNIYHITQGEIIPYTFILFGHNNPIYFIEYV